MIDRTFVAEEQSILNRLREQEAKLNGNYTCYQLFLNQYNCKNKYYMHLIFLGIMSLSILYLFLFYTFRSLLHS